MTNDCRKAITYARNHSVIFWDLERMSLIRTFESNSFVSADMSGDAKVIAIGIFDSIF